LDVAFGGSLVGLRAPSALIAGLVVVLTGLIARELGADRGAQLLAAGAMAVSAFLLAVGHLLSTSTLDLLVWTALSWLIVRGARVGGRIWLAVGLVAGIGLENKWQPAFLLAGLLLGVLVVGPRAVLGTRWPWLGGLVALAVWAPNLVWQAAHGFPQLQLSAAIALTCGQLWSGVTSLTGPAPKEASVGNLNLVMMISSIHDDGTSRISIGRTVHYQ
jgi:4-amino-4-deoxy-L-arabinose transferase-like glycosyltransferase